MPRKKIIPPIYGSKTSPFPKGSVFYDEVNRNYKPWGRQEKSIEIVAQKGIPGPDRILSWITEIRHPDHLREARVRAFIALLYLTGARISEILGKEAYTPKGSLKVKKTDFGIKFEQIRLETINERAVLSIRLKNRKNPKKPWKEMIIPQDLDFEAKISGFVTDYVRMMVHECNVSPHEYLFRFSCSYGRRILRIKYGFNCHFIRHVRATHLPKFYDFDVFTLMDWMGWTSVDMARAYIVSSKADMLKKFKPTIRLLNN